MCDAHRRSFLMSLTLAAAGAGALIVCGSAGAQTPAQAPAAKWVCPPCGCAADGHEFDAPGACPDCGMTLVPKPGADDGRPNSAPADAPKGSPDVEKPAPPGGGVSTSFTALP